MDELIRKSIFKLEENYPQYSLRLWMKNNRFKLIIIFFLWVTFLIVLPEQSYVFIFYLLNILYLITQSSKAFITIIGIYNYKQDCNFQEPLELPKYTIMVPLYKEDKIIYNLFISMEKIDYPKDLLEILLLVEENDKITKRALSKLAIPNHIKIINIPKSYPRTKPKACNYGLNFATGKYITVYDAEDRPSENQLKQVVAKFSLCTSQVICIQARLNYYNREENYLTKLFSIEYSILFEYMLEGLKKLSLPIPLGGTSNHFIREKLIELGGWDSFNVTEDADLGLRLNHAGYKTELIASTTYEESPITLKAWIKQRSRWIKGHLLTSLLHVGFKKKVKLKDLVGIMLTLYIPSLIYILIPFFILITIFNLKIPISSIFWKINLPLALLLPFILSLFIIIRNKWYNSKSAIFLSFFYYWLLPIAGIRSLIQVFTSPFKWEKTEHGLSSYVEHNK